MSKYYYVKDCWPIFWKLDDGTYTSCTGRVTYTTYKYLPISLSFLLNHYGIKRPYYNLESQIKIIKAALTELAHKD